MHNKNPAHNLAAEVPVTAPVSHSTQSESAVETGKHVLQELMNEYAGPLALRLWNGETVVGAPDAPCTVTFNHPSVLRDLILRPGSGASG